MFEGAPVADARSVYVGLTDRVEMTASYVVCLDAETGQPGGFATSARRTPTSTRSRPTSRSRTACSPSTGRPCSTRPTSAPWRRSTPRPGRSAGWPPTPGRGAVGGGGFNNGFGGMGMMAVAARPQQRDLNPAIVHDGLVIIAPDETPHIFAFDAATGRQVWQTEAIPDEVKLDPPAGRRQGEPDRHRRPRPLVRRQDRQAGALLAREDAGDAGVRPRPARGRPDLLADQDRDPHPRPGNRPPGRRADPPERDLRRRGGEPRRRRRLPRRRAGELAGGLLPEQPADRALPRRDRPDPDDALNYFRLAQAAEAIGRDDLALESLDLALPRARTSETIDGVPLAEATREHRRRLLMKLGEKAKLAKNWPEAARRFEEAGQAAPVDRDRLAARLELAEVQLLSGDPRGAVRTWQALLGDERLRALTVDATDGHRTVRADLLIVDRLNACSATGGVASTPSSTARRRPPGPGPGAAGSPPPRRPATALPRRRGRPRSVARAGDDFTTSWSGRATPRGPTSGSSPRRPTTPPAPGPGGAWPGRSRPKSSGCPPAKLTCKRPSGGRTCAIDEAGGTGAGGTGGEPARPGALRPDGWAIGASRASPSRSGGGGIVTGRGSRS